VIRKLTAAPAVVAAALLLVGCGRTGAGVAARVGDARIMTSALEARVTRGYANRTFAQQQTQADYQRAWLNRLITSRLVEVAAKRLHVSVSDQEIDQRLEDFAKNSGGLAALEQQAAGQGIAKEDLRQAIADLSLRDAVADKLVENVTVTDAQLRAEYQRELPHLDVAHIAHVVVTDKKTADKVAAEARGGADFAALAKKYSQDQNTAPSGGDLGNIGNGEGKFQKAFEQAVFTGKTGSIVGPVKAQSGYEIIKVIERRTTTYAQARTDLRRAVIGQTRDQKMATYLTDLATELGVTVNPRFGTWDPANAGVSPADGNVLSSPAPSPGDLQGGPPGAPPGGPAGPPPGQGGQTGAPAPSPTGGP
jgi:foldase protein PrsA